MRNTQFGAYFHKLDMFPYSIPLFFEKDSTTKSSQCGAFCSIILVMLCIYQSIVLVQESKDINHQIINQMEYEIDLSKEERLNLSDSHAGIYMVLTDTKGVPIAKKYSAELDSYISISFGQVIEDWYKTNDYMMEQRYNAKVCTIADLGNDTNAQKTYKQWHSEIYQYDLLCPDLREHDFQLYNMKGEMQADSIMLTVETCDNKKRSNSKPCKSETEIQEFLQTSKLMVWFTSLSQDLRYFEHKSVIKNAKLIHETDIKKTDLIKRQIVYLDQGEFISDDHLLGLKTHKHMWKSLTVGQTRESVRPKQPEDENVLYQTQFYRSPIVKRQTRHINNFIILISQLGGLIKVLQSIFAIFIKPISEYLFTITFIKVMYFAKTTDDQMFDKLSKKDRKKYGRSRYLKFQNMPNELKNTSFADDNRNHRWIGIKCVDQVLLFLHQWLPCFNKCCCWWSKKLAMQRLYTKGRKKMQKSLNVVNILKQLSELVEIINQHQMKNKDSHWVLRHSKNNIIDCDEDPSHHESSDQDQSDDFEKQQREMFENAKKYQVKQILQFNENLKARVKDEIKRCEHTHNTTLEDERKYQSRNPDVDNAKEFGSLNQDHVHQSNYKEEGGTQKMVYDSVVLQPANYSENIDEGQQTSSPNLLRSLGLTEQFNATSNKKPCWQPLLL